MANILHNVLADIMGDLKNLMEKDAILVLSGILDEKKQVVIEAIKKHNLKLVEETHQDIWTGLVVKN
ncbi:Ribosomal protein L11 methyltransferase [bioreactor metagenome]|uniref:Ribosomal protein L11 methyltransferase n=1 Tax=bioreactor metagenome TaxID=1076179 RepID=A0A645J3X8_9ZZZZ